MRSIFERALTAVGLHVTKGTALWEAYREFENAILETAQVSLFPWAPIPKKSCGAAPGVTWSCLLPVVSQLFLPDPVLQENHSVGLADQVVDLYFSKILKSSQIQVQSLALLLTEVPRTALN